MINIIINTTFLTILMLVLSSPSFANNEKKEVLELVGYEITEKIDPNSPQAKNFSKIDKNKDESLSFEEFRDYEMKDNEYDIFLRVDQDNNKSISLEEFVSYPGSTKGYTHFKSQMNNKLPVSGTNTHTKVFHEKHYFIPVRRAVE